MFVALGLPTSLMVNETRLLLLPVALPMSPTMVIFDKTGVSSGELRASVTLRVFVWLGLLVDWPMCTLNNDRACTRSGTASPVMCIQKKVNLNGLHILISTYMAYSVLKNIKTNAAKEYS